MKKCLKFFSSHKHISVFIIILLIHITLAVLLLNNKNFDKVGSYKQPICSSDLTVFESDVCSKCNSNIMDTGLLKGINETIKSVKFNTVYSSYKDFKDARNSVLPLSLLFVFFIIMHIANIIWYFVDKRLLKKKGK